MWSLRANGGVKAVTGKNDGVGWKREQFRIYRMNDGVKVATLERGISWTTWKQRVSSEQQRRIGNSERDRAFCVARVMNGM
jgi:hypothetical protein